MRKTALLFASMALALVLASGVAAAAITTTTNAYSLANAISQSPEFVAGADFERAPGSTQNAVSDSALGGLPTYGSDYAILTTGDANKADDVGTHASRAVGTGSRSGTGSDYDASVLKIYLTVPDGGDCLSIDFRFLSEEYPEFVGSGYNDAFVAELDRTTWRAEGKTINAPDNFAFDEREEEISINSTGNTTVSPEEAKGTAYDASTKLLQAKTPITPGSHTLYLSIFDQGDSILDAAAFVDNLRLFDAAAGACAKGAVLKSADRANGAATEWNETTQNKTAFAQGSWRNAKSGIYHGGHALESNWPGDYAEIWFEGTEIAWTTEEGPFQGITDIFLDGEKVASHDGYAATSRSAIGFQRGGLTNRQHTLKLEVSGRKNPLSKGTWTTHDHHWYRYCGTCEWGYASESWASTDFADKRPDGTYSVWYGYEDSKATGGMYRSTDDTQGYMQMRGFRGPWVGVKVRRSPAGGLGLVQVYDRATGDLVKQNTINCYSDTVTWGNVQYITGLDQNKVYDLRISSHAGKPVSVDGFVGFNAE